MQTPSSNQTETIKVEYAGYLPIFVAKKVGTHPQFKHLKTPPAGYEFVGTKLSENSFYDSLDLDNLIYYAVKLAEASLKNGAQLNHVIEFIQSRSLISQLLVPQNAELLFLPSFPMIIGQKPWIIEIEDVTTLFDPFLINGSTTNVEIRELPYYPIIKTLLESDSCRGIITHVKSTADSLPKIFESEKIAQKVTHQPLGIILPSLAARKLPNSSEDNQSINLLFNGSYHQKPEGFYSRGGIDVLEAFAKLSIKYPQISLTIRSKLPDDLDSKYKELVQNNSRIKLLESYLPDDELEAIFAETDIYLLPAARLHVVSILEVMGRGIPCIVSDGWGIEEYVDNGHNGLVVKGRYGKASWIDPETGMLKEDASILHYANLALIEDLIKALSSLIEDPELRSRLGKNAREDVATKFSIDNWNIGLKKALDQAMTFPKPEPISHSPLLEHSKFRYFFSFSTQNPQFVEEFADFNIIALNNQFYACRHSLGGLDLLTEPVGRKEILPSLLIGESIEDLRARIKVTITTESELEKVRAKLEGGYPNPTLIESFEKYNIVAWMGKYYAILQELGAIDMAENSMLDDISKPFAVLIDISLERLKTLISEIERSHSEIERSHLEIERSHSEIERSHAQIQAMESSKFWKLRSAWLRLKDAIKLTQK